MTVASEVIEGDIRDAEPTRALAIPEERALIASFDPVEVIARATRQATALARIIEDRRLYTKIGQGRHVNVEGWQTLGALNGLQAFTERVSVTRTEDGHLEALAVVSARRVSDGIAVAQVEGFCSTREARWKGRDEYAVRSMAQTRATSKVFRQALAWVMVLAGYAPTPAEEVPRAVQHSGISTEERDAIKLAWQKATPQQRQAALEWMRAQGFPGESVAVVFTGFSAGADEAQVLALLAQLGDEAALFDPDAVEPKRK